MLIVLAGFQLLASQYVGHAAARECGVRIHSVRGSRLPGLADKTLFSFRSVTLPLLLDACTLDNLDFMLYQLKHITNLYHPPVETRNDNDSLQMLTRKIPNGEISFIKGSKN